MNLSNKIQNSFKVKSHCTEIFKVHTVDSLVSKGKGGFFNSKTSIVGGGYNIIPRSFVDGLVVQSNLSTIEATEDNNNYVLVKVGSGVVWDDLVAFTVSKGYLGLENLSLIPGSVGAAPVQNIGAYGVEASTFIQTVHCYNLKTGTFCDLSKDECEFGYRTSYFKSKPELFICHVTFRLCKSNLLVKELINSKKYSKLEFLKDTLRLIHLSFKSITLNLFPRPKIKFSFSCVRDILTLCILPAKIKRKLVSVIRTKTLHNPEKIGNCGCFFKCPILPYEEFEDLRTQFPKIEWFEHDKESVKVSVCWLMKNTNWAGRKANNVLTDTKRPVVLLNAGSATGEDVLHVMSQIQQDVKLKFNISLEAEVVIL
ncbi:UDP-N-acetylmuramate dehydrogenase [Pseudomonas jessenii]|uniref:UDP-N-acetylmuramate dehydrogenase n=1 Tax=Pseudomonas jessenii TaxID=77298 RepID=UPI0030C1998F